MSPDGSATSRQFYSTTPSTTTSSSVNIGVAPSAPARKGVRASKAVQDAVYAHIRAVRSLGRETIDTSDIAAALGLTVEAVNLAISSLAKKGVKIV